jgi:hypothetical protein
MFNCSRLHLFGELRYFYIGFFKNRLTRHNDNPLGQLQGQRFL